MLIGLTGPPCAGKRAVAAFLVQQHAFQFISLGTDSQLQIESGQSASGPLCCIFGKQGSQPSLASILDYVTARWRENFVMVGLDTLEQLAVFRRRPFFLLVSVDAPLMVRWHRFQQHQHHHRFESKRSPESLAEFIAFTDSVLHPQSQATAAGNSAISASSISSAPLSPAPSQSAHSTSDPHRRSIASSLSSSASSSPRLRLNGTLVLDVSTASPKSSSITASIVDDHDQQEQQQQRQFNVQQQEALHDAKEAGISNGESSSSEGRRIDRKGSGQVAWLMIEADVHVHNIFGTLEQLWQHLDQLRLNSLVRLRPTWDMYFMQLAELASRRSNCMKRRVGAVLVRDRRVVATGYNGTPRGCLNCNEGGCMRCNSNASCGTRLDECLCLHAEENALLEAGRERSQGCVLYCSTCPCLGCAKKICQSGVQEVVYSRSYGMDEASARLLAQVAITLRQLDPEEDLALHANAAANSATAASGTATVAATAADDINNTGVCIRGNNGVMCSSSENQNVVSGAAANDLFKSPSSKRTAGDALSSSSSSLLSSSSSPAAGYMAWRPRWQMEADRLREQFERESQEMLLLHQSTPLIRLAPTGTSVPPQHHQMPTPREREAQSYERGGTAIDSAAENDGQDTGDFSKNMANIENNMGNISNNIVDDEEITYSPDAALDVELGPRRVGTGIWF